MPTPIVSKIADELISPFTKLILVIFPFTASLALVFVQRQIP